MKNRTREKIISDTFSFIAFLQKNGFIFSFSEKNNNRLKCEFRSKLIIGWIFLDFNSLNEETFDWKYTCRVFVDNVKSFNKTWQCPFQKKIPKPKQYEAYLNRFNFWASKEGQKKSNHCFGLGEDCDL